MPGTVTWRIGLEGGEAVKQELKDVGYSGRDAAQLIGTAWAAAADAPDRVRASYELLGQEIQIAARRQQEVLARQAQINAASAPGLTRPAKSASDAAEVFRQQAELEAQAQRLRAALDPLVGAQMRLDHELADYNRLAKAGVISTDDLARAQGAARMRYDETAAAMARMAKTGLSPAQQAGRLNLTRQAADVFTTGAMGMNPGMIAIQQGPQILDALATSGIKVTASMAAIGAATLVAGAAIAVLAISAKGYADGVREIDTAVGGLGRTSGATREQVQQIATALNAAGEGTIKDARTIEVALLNTGKVGAEALEPATRAVLAYARTVGVDAKEAASTLVKTFTDPAKGAEELNRTIGFLDQGTLKHIRTLEEQGRRTEAQIILGRALETSLKSTAAQIDPVTAAYRALATWASNAAQAMGRATLAALGFDLRTDQQKFEDKVKGRASLAADIGGHGGDPAKDPLIAAYDREITGLRAKLDAGNRETEKVARQQAAQEAADRHALANPKDGQRRELQNRKIAITGDRDRGFASPAQAAADIAAIDKQIGALDKVTVKHDRHAEAVRRDAAAMRENSAGALAAADAYLRSTAEGERAEAERKARTDATRKGVDVSARVRAQQAIADGQAAENGAKAVAALRDRTAAEAKVNDLVEAGLVPRAKAARALSDELAVSPLIAREARARAAGNVKEADTLLRVAAAQRAALVAAHVQEDRGQEGRDREQRADALEQLRLAQQAAALGPQDEERRLQLVRARADLEARMTDRQPGTAAYTSLINDRLEEDRVRREGDRAVYLAQTGRSMSRETQMLQAQLSLGVAGALVRERVLAALRTRNELEDHNVAATSAEGEAIIKMVDDQVRLNQALQVAQAGYESIHRLGDGLVDQAGEVAANLSEGWSAWGTAGVNAAKLIQAELIKLSLVNPLKNALNGDEALPTLSSVGGLSGIWRAIVNRGVGPTISNLQATGQWLDFGAPGYATGTFSALPGWAVVGERGPEWMRMAGGERVLPHGVAPRVPMPIPATVGGPAASSPGVVVNDYRTQAAPAPKVSRGSSGEMVIDLYDAVLKPGLRAAGQDGTLETALRGGTSQRIRRG